MTSILRKLKKLVDVIEVQQERSRLDYITAVQGFVYGLESQMEEAIVSVSPDLKVERFDDRIYYLDKDTLEIAKGGSLVSLIVTGSPTGLIYKKTEKPSKYQGYLRYFLMTRGRYYPNYNIIGFDVSGHGPMFTKTDFHDNDTFLKPEEFSNLSEVRLLLYSAKHSIHKRFYELLMNPPGFMQDVSHISIRTSCNPNNPNVENSDDFELEMQRESIIRLNDAVVLDCLNRTWTSGTEKRTIKWDGTVSVTK